VALGFLIEVPLDLASFPYKNWKERIVLDIILIDFEINVREIMERT